jgi:hypothetical protein
MGIKAIRLFKKDGVRYPQVGRCGKADCIGKSRGAGFCLSVRTQPASQAHTVSGRRLADNGIDPANPMLNLAGPASRGMRMSWSGLPMSFLVDRSDDSQLRYDAFSGKDYVFTGFSCKERMPGHAVGFKAESDTR